ncbi:MAG: glycolate oxidase subunit GlcE, partial [Giesbergeria sp.]|nr:glycolate oxidase subunit GlcE [Giesbergeria sp.]
AACREQQLPWFAARAQQPGLDVWRLSLPATAPVLALPAGVAPPLIEWHGALRWVQAGREHAAALHAAAAQVGGSASLFIAGGAVPASAGGHFDPISAAQRCIHERLAHSFDPAGIFNPGRMAWQR